MYLKYINNFIICITSEFIDTCGPYFGLDCIKSISNYLEEKLLVVLRIDEQPEELGSFFPETLLTVSRLRFCTPKRLYLERVNLFLKLLVLLTYL